MIRQEALRGLLSRLGKLGAGARCAGLAEYRVMNPRQLTVTRRIFAGGAAAPILLAYLVMVILGRPGIMEAGLVLLQFSPLFLPAAVYYFWVTEPRAVVLCGTILLALTAPPWLLVCAGELHYLAQGPYFLATLVTSIVGTVKSQSTAPAL